MKTANLASISELLAPINGDRPEGDASLYPVTLSQRIKELRTEEKPEDFDDATRPPELKKADWKEISRLCQETLKSSSKDLRVAGHLVEAWTRLEGFAGLERGLQLLTHLVTDCWDRLNPPLDDDPGESRGTPLANQLNDPDRGTCFPSLLRTLPLLGSGPNATSLVEWRRQKSNPDQGAQQRSKLLASTTPEQLQAMCDDINASLQALDELRAALDAKLGDEAPALLNLKEVILEAQGLMQNELAHLVAGEALPSSGDEASTGDAEPMPGMEQLKLPALQNASLRREEIFLHMERAAEMLQQLEPHSPIPYMVKRAVRLGRLPFPHLLEHMVRERNTLAEINREFGLMPPQEV